MLSDRRTILVRAWKSYTLLCSWCPVGMGQFTDGFEDLIAWTFADLDWLERIAEAFNAAGKGKLPTTEVALLIERPASEKEMKRKLLDMSWDDRHDYIDSDEFRAWTIRRPELAKSLLDSLTANEHIEHQSDGNKAFLKRYWLQKAMDQAGIDPSEWDPKNGTKENLEIIKKVYDFYGDLYLANEDLKWSGMATTIGPSFVAGFKDLENLREIAQLLADVTDDHILNGVLFGPWGIPLVSGGEAASWVLDHERELLNKLANVTDEELEFTETSFLHMQKEIFTDQAIQHVAYTQGGIEEIDRLVDAGVLPPEMGEAWWDIDSGDEDRIWAGNKRLLHREQNEIIPEYYDEMREYGALGGVVTWGMTIVGQPSIPGAKRFPEVYPVRPLILSSEDILGVDKDSPLCQDVYFRTGFPDGNISRQQDRWNYIEEDTLPAFYRYETQQNSALKQELNRDFDERVDDVRFLKNKMVTVGNFINDFKLEYEPCSENGTP